MTSNKPASFWVHAVRILPLIAWISAFSQSADGYLPASNVAGILKRGDGTVRFARGVDTPEVNAAYPTRLENRSRIRTGGGDSRAFLEWDDKTDQVLYRNTVVEVELDSPSGKRRPSVTVRAGAIRVSHRGAPGSIQAKTPELFTVNSINTEYVVEYDPGTRESRVIMLDGAATIETPVESKQLDRGNVGIARPGQPIEVRPIRTVNIVQWWVSFPAVLDPDTIVLQPEDQAALAEVMAAYRRGNPKLALRALAGALDTAWAPSEPAKVFLAGLSWASGSPDQAEELIKTVPPSTPGYRALRTLQAALTPRLPPGPDGDTQPDWVTSPAPNQSPKPETSSDRLADSYRLQALHQLDEAVAEARQSAEFSPKFGYAWIRWAELEFSRGHLRQSFVVASRAFALSPDSAELNALLGFLEAAQGRMENAEAFFEAAIRLNPALADGWQGRGLCRLRRGDRAGGIDDLRSAAATDPSRAQAHAYLGKAFADEGDKLRATAEFDLARGLDEQDPTPWLYSALLDRNSNRPNSAIRNFEAAEALGSNRSVYRSQPLLLQDRALSRVNQALVFRESGLEEVALRSALRAVALEPGLASAHRFLAESYATGTRDNLHDETARVSEYLQANLLSPVAGGTLSPTLSQHEYSALFERAGLEIFSSTEYRSPGSWFQSGGIRGLADGTAALAEGTYQSVWGNFPNTDFEESSASLQAKQQLSLRDDIFLQTAWLEAEGGDLSDGNESDDIVPDIRVRERIEPLALLGWHRAWSTEHSTLVLLSGVRGHQELVDPTMRSEVLVVSNIAHSTTLTTFERARDYAAEIGLAGLELQEQARFGPHSVVAGVLLQAGNVAAEDALGGSLQYTGHYLPSSRTEITSGFERGQIYAYDTWQVAQNLHVTGALSYDWLKYPENHRYHPLEEGEASVSQFSPKVGAIWQVGPVVWCRAGYARALGGFSYDQSLRIEPTQVAGFNQAFRSLVPEAVAGPSSAPTFEIAGLALEGKFGANTWWGMELGRRSSEVRRTFGLWVDDADFLVPLTPKNTQEDLSYLEHSLHLNFQRLIGQEFAVGIGYRLNEVEYEDHLPELVKLPVDQNALLHEVAATASFNRVSGFFAQAHLAWLHQEHSDSLALDHDNGWRADFFAGWRFQQRRAELSVGVLNAGDDPFRFNPLSGRDIGPRERTFVTRLLWRY